MECSFLKFSIYFAAVWPTIAGCQKTSEKFGYDPPDELTAHNNGIKEPDRWIPCTEVCLAKEIPKIRNSVMRTEKIVSSEFDNLKEEFEVFRNKTKETLERLNEFILRAHLLAGSEMDFESPSVSVFCSSNVNRTTCSKAFGSKTQSVNIHEYPFTTGFSTSLPVTVSKVGFRLYDAKSSDNDDDVAKSVTFRILGSVDAGCRNDVADGRLKWRLLEHRAHSFYNGLGLESRISEFDLDEPFRCVAVKILASSTDSLRIGGIRMKLA